MQLLKHRLPAAGAGLDAERPAGHHDVRHASGFNVRLDVDFQFRIDAFHHGFVSIRAERRQGTRVDGRWQVKQLFGGNEITTAFVFRCFVILMVVVSVLWIPVVQSMQGGQLFIYIQMISAYLAPPIAAVYLAAILWKRANEQVFDLAVHQIWIKSLNGTEVRF